DGGARRRDFEVALPHRVEVPTDRGSSHFGHHSGASIGDCDRRVGLMIGTAITKVLRGPGAALSILVLCATPAAAQFSFPFSPPPPPPARPGSCPQCAPRPQWGRGQPSLSAARKPARRHRSRRRGRPRKGGAGQAL